MGEGHSALKVGPFEVRVTRAEAKAFHHATRDDDEMTRVPFTFPIRWLARPEIHAAAARLIGGDDWVPIHESQSFDYRQPLALDCDYRMRIAMSHEDAPPRILLHAEVGKDGDDDYCLRMEMILRIITMPQKEPSTRP